MTEIGKLFGVTVIALIAYLMEYYLRKEDKITDLEPNTDKVTLSG